MRVLIDTNIFVWFIAGSDRLNHQAINIMTDMNNELVLSVASLWEIAIKSSLGKLELLRPFDQLIPEQLELHEVDILQIELPHLLRIISLPFQKNIVRPDQIRDYKNSGLLLYSFVIDVILRIQSSPRP